LNIVYVVSTELDVQFADWATLFERNYNKDSFDWAAWEEWGIALALRLKKEVGDRYAVEYHYPLEDHAVPGPHPVIVIE